MVAALFAANGVHAEDVATLDTGGRLAAIHTALTDLSGRIAQHATNKLLCCCSFREALRALDRIGHLRAPGRSYGAPADLLNKWLDATYGRDKREALNLSLQRLASLVATNADCGFWERFCKEEACHIASFEQLRYLHTQDAVIQRYCSDQGFVAMCAAESPREVFFRAVFSEHRPVVETKTYVATLLQATVTRMQLEAAQQAQPAAAAAAATAVPVPPAEASEVAATLRKSTRKQAQSTGRNTLHTQRE